MKLNRTELLTLIQLFITLSSLMIAITAAVYAHSLLVTFGRFQTHMESLELRQNRNEKKLKAWSNVIVWLSIQEINRNPDSPPPQLPEPLPGPKPRAQMHESKLTGER